MCNLLSESLPRNVWLGFLLWGLLPHAVFADAPSFQFDCGTSTSQVQEGFRRLTADERYSAERGYGWVGRSQRSVEFENPGFLRQHIRPRETVFQQNLTDLNCDAVVCDQPLTFRVNVPDGAYRIILTIGDMSQAIGSMEVAVNGEIAESPVTAFTPGGYRDIIKQPYGWWTDVRHSTEASDGKIEISVKKNQTYYDEQMAIQSQWSNPFRQWFSQAPEKAPPYFFVSFPFVHNSIMAIQVVPDNQPPIAVEDGRLKATEPFGSDSLRLAIESFNAGTFGEAHRHLRSVSEPDAAIEKALLALHLAGRLEIEAEKELVEGALPILRQYVSSHPEEVQVAELLCDARNFHKGLTIFLERGDPRTNHFIEIDRAIGWLWLVKDSSPLYDKALLQIARSEHMLRPYRPTLGTCLEIFKQLEKKCPTNRFVKYHLHYEWENYGDGSHAMDWHVGDYETRVKDSPPWVRDLYVTFSQLIDVSEWWIKFKQHPDGSIGGGLSDDVEMVGAFGYVGYVGRGVSDQSLQGARNLVKGIWELPQETFSAELGYQTPLADAEHTAELTGDSLPMVIRIDYGNPTWIELSLKTAQLMRDLWTAPNVAGHRHFRANFLGAAQVGQGDQANDSWINYRAVAPALAVLWYNQNPAISQLIQEIADGWVAAAMSTQRGKPRGVIPAQVSFPDNVLGGTNSPRWWKASHTPGTVNYDWPGTQYKGLIQNVLIAAYAQTGDAKYVEPLRLEYELAQKHKDLRARFRRPKKNSPPRRQPQGRAPTEGSEEWVAVHLDNVETWLDVLRMIKGRQGELEIRLTRDQITEWSKEVLETLMWRWPLMTTESSATDRVYFGGWMRPLIVYAGGQFTGRGFEADITYENTTRHFAAAVLGADSQGFRLLYHSLTTDTREIGIVPWTLEPNGSYLLRYGPDRDEDNNLDTVTEERRFNWPQRGAPILITVEPGTTYLVEVDQLARGTRPRLAPDPAIEPDDIRKVEDADQLFARVHNIGSKKVRNVKVAFYDGDPDAGGERIGTALIPNIEAPVNLSARHVTVGINWAPSKEKHDIHVVIDPDRAIENEITTFNNRARTTISRARQVPEKKSKKPPVAFGPRGRR